MGSWDTAIFSDDTAADIREAFLAYIGDGLSSEMATSRLKTDFASSLDDPDESSSFWLALASTQYDLGRLLPEVLANALRVIDDGTDLKRWEENRPARAKREVALKRIRSKLLASQPACKSVPRRYQDTNKWKPGQLIGYRLTNGQLCLFRVIGEHLDRGGSSPIAELIDWLGLEIPSLDAVKTLPIRRHRYPNGTEGISQFMLGGTSARDFPKSRVIETSYFLKAAQRPGGFAVFLWRFLDRQLQEFFSIGQLDRMTSGRQPLA